MDIKSLIDKSNMMCVYMRIAILAVILLGMPNAAFAAFDQCSPNANGELTITMAGIAPNLCNTDPTSIKVSAYKIGLCTELPYASNYLQVCDFIYDSPSPIEVIAEKGTVRLIEGITEISLPTNKTYTHSALLLDLRKYIKSTLHFPSERIGKTGQGRYCWSIGAATETGRATRNDFTAECGSLSDANAKFNYTTRRYMWSAVDDTILAVERNFPADGWTNEMMSSETTKAIFNGGSIIISDDDPTTDSNAVYLLSGRPISPYITITSQTVSLDLGLKVSYGSLVNYSGTHETSSPLSPADCAITPCITGIQSAGLDFSVTAK